ncbi:MAG: hypothetical protein J7455_08735 [Roseiflexus sp.]|nr:hypothetical protein [Roseiflexus sp.]MBO9366114.1 hypothetical protein [Roseiflexus sp.]MBO9390341.1 hypothetical protein [Roseiflexus sp.]
MAPVIAEVGDLLAATSADLAAALLVLARKARGRHLCCGGDPASLSGRADGREQDELPGARRAGVADGY